MHRLTIVFLLCAIVSVVISRSPIPPCHPTCTNHCPDGYQIDSRGCTTACKCKKTHHSQCGKPYCPSYCRIIKGRIHDECPICVCKKSEPKPCPLPYCVKSCRSGFATDHNGCPTCECKKSEAAPCPLPLCTNTCRYGFATDQHGCPTCHCKKTPCGDNGKPCKRLRL